MKRFVIIGFLLTALQSWASNFTPFYVAQFGDNLNAGSDTNALAFKTYASGSWVNSTGVFTPASGNPLSDGVTNGAWASVYPDATSLDTVFVGRVIAVDSTTITVSLAAYSGIPPVDGSVNTTCKIGGCWRGMNGNDPFPTSFVNGIMTNAAGNSPFVYFKAGTSTNYYINVTMIETNSTGPVWWGGYTNIPGDNGWCEIDGNTNGSVTNILNITSGKNRAYQNFIFATNYALGSPVQHLINVSVGTENMFYHCVAHDAWLCGFNQAAASMFIGLEAYNCDLANNSTYGGIRNGSPGGIMINCISHDNTNSHVAGFETDGTQMAVGCIAFNNGADGFRGSGDVQLALYNCEAWNNGGNGVLFTGASGPIADPLTVALVNFNFLKNGGMAVSNSASAGSFYLGLTLNNAYGLGTMTNTVGNIYSRIQGLNEVRPATYPTDTYPWTDPTNGNFSILTSAALAGYGSFTETGLGRSGTVGYPDIGAAQATNGPASGGEHSSVFAQ